MAFSKAYFEKIGELIRDYSSVYPCMVTLTIRVHGQDYNVVRVLKCDDELLPFAFYCDQKSAQLPEKIIEKTGEPRAWPALTIPYEAIESVEFNPGEVAGQKGVGFTYCWLLLWRGHSSAAAGNSPH